MLMLNRYFDPVFGILCVLGLVIGYFKVLPDNVLNIALLVVNLIGFIPILRSVYKALRNREITVDLLAVIALVFSLLVGEYASALFIQLMLLFARILSNYTDSSIHQALKFLMKLKPLTAHLLAGEDTRDVGVSEVKAGDIVIVRLGERIPVDGIVLEGQGSIDQSSFTGESLPIEAKQGSHVLTSTLLTSGELKIQAEKVGKDTAFSHVIKLVEQSDLNKSKIIGISKKFASLYVVVILVAAISLLVITGNLTLVVSVLLVVCADDIAIAIPLAFTAAMAKAARQGVLIKGGIFLEAMAKLNTLLMDKTGTLTTGKLQVHRFINLYPTIYNDAQLLEFAGSLSDLSDHPISKAIHSYMHDRRITVSTVSDFVETAGKGVSGQSGNYRIQMGKLPFVLTNNVKQPASDVQNQIDLLSASGNNLTFLAVNEDLAAIFVIADQIKPEAKQMVSDLQSLGVNDLVMLTGDNPRVAMTVANILNLPNYKSDLLPEDKLEFIKQKVASNKVVAMMGDGVNDAPALNLATIGISMGGIGSDVAIESADIVLMRDDLGQIPNIIRLGRRVLNIAKQNIALWVIINAIGLVLVFTKVLSPEGAAAYNFVTDVFTLLNAMRIMIK